MAKIFISLENLFMRDQWSCNPASIGGGENQQILLFNLSKPQNWNNVWVLQKFLLHFKDFPFKLLGQNFEEGHFYIQGSILPQSLIKAIAVTLRVPKLRQLIIHGEGGIENGSNINQALLWIGWKLKIILDCESQSVNQSKMRLW